MSAANNPQTCVKTRSDSAVSLEAAAVTPKDVGLPQFSSFRQYIDFLLPKLVNLDRSEQARYIDEYFAKDAVFIDPFVRVRGIDKVKLILGLIGPTCTDAQIKIMDVFVQDRTGKTTTDFDSVVGEPQLEVAAPFNLPRRVSADKGNTVEEFGTILPPATHTNSQRAAVILQTDTVHQYVFKDVLPFRLAQLVTGRSFAYRSTHKTYINGDGKIIQHEEIYSIREFLENFTAVRWLYRFYSWSNEMIWRPTNVMDAILRYYSD